MADYRDGYTVWMGQKMDEWSEKIYDIDDGLSSVEDNVEGIVKYLKNITCSNPLGLALRRYLCTKFSSGKAEDSRYVFELKEKTLSVSDYIREDYNIYEDDIAEYVEIFMHINERFNSDSNGNLLLKEFTKAEARRMLRIDTSCTREKLFLLSFALHMNNNDVHKFLTDVLAEQTYNFRNPYEVIAYFCHSSIKYNSYSDYLRLKKKYESLSFECIETQAIPKYTSYANLKLTTITNEEELFEFIRQNTVNFKGFSQTAYNEFMLLYQKVLEKAKIQTFSNEEYLFSTTVTTKEKRKNQEERINKAIELQTVKNTEQLAKLMLQCIPRATTEKIKNGKTVVTNDFISIHNGEKDSKSKKIQTTSLPKEITMNLLMKDRIDDLLKKIKAVERKDLVFLKFFLFSLDLQEKGNYSSSDYCIFIDECNDMLVRCGMSRLYLANRFENLILLSLVSENPFEMFENIIEYSFMNEPSTEKSKT